ncbi:MAG TPA: DUF5615 family PIN-like protein [Solirubrobacteraceae bacterium]
MRLLLDEMLSPQIARNLRERGHDVLAIAERAEWLSPGDDEVIELARAQRRAIVTNNLRDYRPRAAAAALPGGPSHYGMVFIPGAYRLRKADIGGIVLALLERLAAHPEENGLHNQETWLGIGSGP